MSLTVTDAVGVSFSASSLQITVNPVTTVNVVASSTTENIGVGQGNGLEIPFTVPTIGAAPAALSAYFSGWVNITACGFLCSNLLAYTLIGTPSEISNIKSGGSVTVIWCYTAGGSTCQAEQNVQPYLDLSGYSGQTLDLYIYNTNLTVGQTATVVVSVTSSA